MLALLAPSFNLVSETFIADHARRLAPGATLLVCQDSRGAEALGYPVLSHLQPRPTGLGPWETRLEDLRFRVNRRFGPALGRADRMRLIAFLQTQGARVVLAEYGYMGAMAARACADLGLPLHVIFHGLDASSMLRERVVLRRYRAMFPHAASLICVSRALADNLVAIGAPEDRIRIVPCGVDPDRFPPGAPEPGRLLAVGRLVEKKAPHLTIRAFARIAGRFPLARLDLIGEGPLRAACEAEIATAGLGDRVTLHGAQPHDAIARHMRRAAIFVQHSVTAANGDTEGFPVAIVEAMSSALPVVSTRHSGIPEGVAEGETGLLVAEGDVAGMAEAIAALLEDPDRARGLGAAGRARALAQFTQDRSLAALRAILGLEAPAP